jgi:threonine dehydrogenase-like Zn-dependent dehydrogenase
MRAVQLIGPGKVVFVDAPKPALKPGYALVRTKLLSLCGSDVHAAYYDHAESYPQKPGVTGHEMIGVVEEVDAPGYDFGPGTVALTLAPYQEAMAEYYLAPAEDVLVLPASTLPYEHFLMAQQLGTVIYACKRIPNIMGKVVAVIGQGSAGLFFDAMCRRMGAEKVIGLDLMQARVDAGLRFGATHTVNNSREDAVKAVERITDGKMADVVIEAAGEVETINMTAHLVKQYGQLLFFGVPRATVFTFDFWTFFRKYAYTTSSGASAFEPGRRSFRQALDLIGSGEIDVSTMVTHRFPFERAPEAYELAKSREDGAVKIVVEMPGYR